MENRSNLPAWDLSDLYSGINDPQVEKDLSAYLAYNQQLSDKYKSKVASLSAPDFAKAIKLYEQASVVASKLGIFAYLNMVTQMKNKEAMAFYQNICEKMTDYAKPTIFFTLELNRLPQSKIDAWLQDEKVAFYRPFITRVRKYKKHELSEPVEEILFEKSITSSDAWVRLYEETSSRLVYTVDGKSYNDAELSKLLLDKDPKIREKAGKEMNRVSKENAPLFSFIYNMIIKDKAIEDVKRGFAAPVSSRNLAENVPDSTVKALSETVRSRYQDIAHRFYKLKAKWLGVDKIQYWDRNAPLPFSDDTSYSWEESVKIVLDAYKEFSPKLIFCCFSFLRYNSGFLNPAKILPTLNPSIVFIITVI